MNKLVELKDFLNVLHKSGTLKGFDLNAAGSNAILGFFKVAESNQTPDDAEKLDILNLVSQSTHQLGEYTNDFYKRRFYVASGEEDEELTCRLHSGFQLLKDDYLDSPIVKKLDQDRRDLLTRLAQEIDYEELEDLARKWAESPINYQPPKPAWIPDSHFWWNSAFTKSSK